jgi:hypothetical protein
MDVVKPNYGLRDVVVFQLEDEEIIGVIAVIDTEDQDSPQYLVSEDLRQHFVSGRWLSEEAILRLATEDDLNDYFGGYPRDGM